MLNGIKRRIVKFTSNNNGPRMNALTIGSNWKTLLRIGGIVALLFNLVSV